MLAVEKLEKLENRYSTQHTPAAYHLQLPLAPCPTTIHDKNVYYVSCYPTIPNANDTKNTLLTNFESLEKGN